MTSTGTRMRRAVAAMAIAHCFAVRRSISPESSAATNTPVPAAESQLRVKRAASGFAPGAATGGMRCTALCSAGISITGCEMELSVFLTAGLPHSAQQTIRIAHGIHASAISRSASPSPGLRPPTPPAAARGRSERSRNLVFGCHANRRKSGITAAYIESGRCRGPNTLK